MARGSKKNGYTKIIILAAVVGIAYWQRDRLKGLFNQAKGAIGMRSRAYVGLNALPYTSTGISKEWYPYYTSHYSI